MEGSPETERQLWPSSLSFRKHITLIKQSYSNSQQCKQRLLFLIKFVSKHCQRQFAFQSKLLHLHHWHFQFVSSFVLSRASVPHTIKKTIDRNELGELSQCQTIKSYEMDGISWLLKRDYATAGIHIFDFVSSDNIFYGEPKPKKKLALTRWRPPFCHGIFKRPCQEFPNGKKSRDE